jgi:hypothetical protein
MSSPQAGIVRNSFGGGGCAIEMVGDTVCGFCGVF